VKQLLLIISLVIPTLALESNPYFKTEADIDKFFVDSSVDVPAEGRGGSDVDIKNGHKIVSIDNSCLCRDDWGAIFTFDWDGDSIVGGNGYILGIDFGDGITFPQLSKEKKDRAKIAIKYLISKSTKKYIEKKIYPDALKSYKENYKKDAAISAKETVERMLWTFYPITTDNVTIYNDLGFFLEQGGKYQEAVTLLEQVIKAVPSREVAYVNLGDSYWGLNKTTEAIGYYKTYVDLLKKAGKEKKISPKVFERLK
jgi:tetratricopeptide (TPR) repeat protein